MFANPFMRTGLFSEKLGLLRRFEQLFFRRGRAEKLARNDVPPVGHDEEGHLGLRRDVLAQPVDDRVARRQRRKVMDIQRLLQPHEVLPQ